MRKILAIGASSSKNSINRTFAIYVAGLLDEAEVTAIDLNDFEMPIYSIDRENKDGIPTQAKAFKLMIETHDGIVLSLAEHNGSYTAAFKNVLDWSSRLQGPLWANTPMFLLSTSPGKRGGATVMQVASTYLPRMTAIIAAKFTLPSFRLNFSDEEGLIDSNLYSDFTIQLESFKKALEKSN
jgi:chromate reductase, NAD(P)H dehydrogenase (quinone)